MSTTKPPKYQYVPNWGIPNFENPSQLYGSMYSQMSPYLADFSNLQAQQSAANTNTLDLTRLSDTKRGMSVLTKKTFGLENKYAPKYAQLYTNILNQVNPGYSDIYSKLGQKVSQDLDLGYSMSPAMQAQVQQDIRGAQDARGNWFGPAPTADEAYGSATARQNLYQNRLQNAEGFLNGRSPVDMLGMVRGNTAATQGWNVQTAPSYVDPGAITTAMGMQYGNQQNAFNDMLGAYDFNNQWRTQNWSNSLYQNALGGMGGGGSGGNMAGAGIGAASGALTGAASGAAVGSVVPGIGTAIGAVGGALIGGLAGGASGYMSGGNKGAAAMSGAAGGIGAGPTFGNFYNAYSYNPYLYGGGNSSQIDSVLSNFGSGASYPYAPQQYGASGTLLNNIAQSSY